MRSFLQYFIKLEAAGGLVLMAAALVAMLWANSPLAGHYTAFFSPLAHPVNDGLMVLFFLVVGIEIKRECVQGTLSTWQKATLPLGAALGGVVLPALIYAAFNAGTPYVGGWAIPSATDIAFSLGVLALFGSRVPVALTIFLMALAVIDDLAAIIIIAAFYTASLNIAALFTALGLCVLLLLCARANIRRITPYALLGVLLWIAVLASGVHATIAGVLLAFCLPNHVGERVLHALHPWVTFAILPLFALASSGVALGGMSAEQLTGSLPAGIALGLFLGKPLGITFAVWLMVKIKIASLPAGVSWRALWAMAMIAGIGFTMSLFIGTLAFADVAIQDAVRVGVLAGSLLSAITGAIFMAYALKKEAVAN